MKITPTQLLKQTGPPCSMMRNNSNSYGMGSYLQSSNEPRSFNFDVIFPNKQLLEDSPLSNDLMMTDCETDEKDHDSTQSS